MNNLEKLPISEADKILLKQSAVNQLRFLGLEYSILAFDSSSITIAVKQKKLINDVILTGKELHEKAKAFIKVDSLDEAISLHIRPVVFNQAETDVVTWQWIQAKMLLHSIRLKDLSGYFGIDKATLSVLVSGKSELTRWHRATFYYFFQGLESK